MKTIELGKLKEVDIRKVWQHEQYDFSSWLAEDENIQLLSVLFEKVIEVLLPKVDRQL